MRRFRGGGRPEAPKEEKLAAVKPLRARRRPAAAPEAPAEPPKEEKFAALNNLFAARAAAAARRAPERRKHAALSALARAPRRPRCPRRTSMLLCNLLAARAVPPAPPSPAPAPPNKVERRLRTSAPIRRQAAPPSPAPYERFSPTFVKGPLGIKFETSERPRVEEAPRTEHHITTGETRSWASQNFIF